MQHKWLGPYVIIASLGHGLYCIKNPNTEHVLKKAVHSARLKQYLSEDPVHLTQLGPTDTLYPDLEIERVPSATSPLSATAKTEQSGLNSIDSGSTALLWTKLSLQVKDITRKADKRPNRVPLAP